MLSLAQMKDVCLLYQGSETCRYLVADENDYQKYYCKKLTSERDLLDELTEDFIQECTKTGADPNDGSTALGDNCKGYLFLKDVHQGWDVDEE